MVRIINNADDFGYSRAINYGIIDSFLNGMLTSTTIMTGMPGFEHAIKLAKENRKLGIGVHLTLTCGRPVLNTHRTLVDENGNFKKLSFYKDEETSVDDDEVYQEWKAQIDKLYRVGIVPTHLDSHHHIHIFKNNPEIVKRLSKEYNLPVRNSFDGVEVLRKDKIKCNDILLNPWTQIEGDFQHSDCQEKMLINEVRRLIDEAAKSHDIIEVMWHPAYLDLSIVSGSAFAYPRLFENEAITNDELVKYIKENFELCTYQDI